MTTRLRSVVSAVTPRRGALAGVATALLWATVLGLEVLRSHPGHSLISRPDRILGGAGAAFWLPLDLAMVAATVLGVVAWLGLRTLLRDRVLWAGSGVVITAAAAALLAVQLFTPDAAMYETSTSRGVADLAFLAAIPVAALLLAAGLWRSGMRVAATCSGAAALYATWLAVVVAAWAATSGSVQPQSDSAIAVWVVAIGWLGSVSLVVMAVPRAPERLASRLPGIGRPPVRLAALAGLGLVAVLALGPMVGSLNAYRWLIPHIETQLSGRTQPATIVVNSVERSYRIHRPSSPAARPGLVLVLSGVYGSGFQAETTTGFDEEADRLGWIAIYPDSVLDGWAAYGGGDAWGNHPGADDVPFFAALIDREIATDGVDPGRVFVTGISRGGMMTYRAGCELAGRVAAIAPVSGNMADSTGGLDVPCHPERPISILAIHGTADGSIPFGGGRVDVLYSPFLDVIAKWRSIETCETSPTTTVDGASTTTSWQCAGGTTVAMRVVDGGWHTWPSAGSSGPDGFDGSRLIGDFFVAHARTAG